MSHDLPAVILAGGLSRRMGGGDKALRVLAGRPVLAHVLDRLGPGPRAINANGDPGRFADFDLPVLPDPLPGHPGPLAGILAGMLWAHTLGAREVLTVSCDLPFLPRDLAARLGPGPAYATSDSRAHPVVGRWPVALATGLRAALENGERRVLDWVSGPAQPLATLTATPDPFLNLNAPEDLARAEAFCRPLFPSQ